MFKSLLLTEHPIQDGLVYNKNWFMNTEIRRLMKNWVDGSKKHTILEIGSYEGLSSVFFATYFLDHAESTLTCVDPFMCIDNNDHASLLQNQEEEHFLHNISICKNKEKIRVCKTISDDFFSQNTKTFDFMYIDGCHECDYIQRDMENGFAVLEKGGIMWMDDYLGGNTNQHPTIKETMDQFLEKHAKECIVIHRGYQLAIQKI